MKRELNFYDDDAIFSLIAPNSFNSFDIKGHEMKTFRNLCHNWNFIEHTIME